MTVSLGLPALPPPVLAPRRKTRKIKVGSVDVGGDAPVSVQSMTTTPTTNINATLQQIAELTATGCDIVRVACPTNDDADALPIIAKKSQIPVIADIHFQPKYVFAAIEAGCAAVRVNPGNIRKFDDQVKEIAQAAKDHGTSIRIGVNAGSLDPRLLAKYGKATPEALVESAVWEASLFEEHDFHDFKISVKHNDPVIMVRAYELLSERGDWPLHLGVTEAGPAFQGTIKSATAFGALLSKGIGDTIRVSLSAPPVEEVKVGIQILQSLNLRPRKLEIVSCPSCGRAQVDVYSLAEAVTEGLEGMSVPLRVAVMGCVVNGPGEAREADLGVASGNGKGQIFVKGEVIKTVPEHDIVATLIEEANRLAAAMGEPEDEAGAGAPVVTRRLRRAGAAHLDRRARERAGCGRVPDQLRRRRSGTLRVLGGADAPALLRLCERDPVANLFVSARLLGLLARPGSDLGGQVWGWFAGGELVSACWAGANLVPVEATPAALDAFAARAREEGRRCSSLVGPAESVLALWQRLEPHWHGVREVRAHQPLMVCDTGPSVEPDPLVRRATLRELDLVVPACVAMFTEEIGYAPLRPTAAAPTAPASRSSSPPAAPSSASTPPARGPEVVFKAELGAVSPKVVQVQGVWVAPHRRGEGLSEPGHGRRGAGRARRRRRSVSLYVNDYNTRALAAYRRVGFREVGSFATVLF